MCGIFAFHGRTPDPDLLAACINGASRRGPHGHGWAVLDTSRSYMQRQLGTLADNTSRIVDACLDLDGTVLGHARMATSGSWNREENLQPFLVNETAIAHNGVIYNPDDLSVNAPTDTVAFTRAFHELRATGLTKPQTVEKLLATAQQTAWAIAVADRDSILVHRHYHPLYVLQAANGVYLSSHRFHADAEPVPADTNFIYYIDRNRTSHAW